MVDTSPDGKCERVLLPESLVSVWIKVTGKGEAEAGTARKCEKEHRRKRQRSDDAHRRERSGEGRSGEGEEGNCGVTEGTDW